MLTENDDVLRLIALESVVRELIRTQVPAEFREKMMATTDAALGRLADVSDEERADFITFRRCVFELLYRDGIRSAPQQAPPAKLPDPPTLRSWFAALLGGGHGRP